MGLASKVNVVGWRPLRDVVHVSLGLRFQFDIPEGFVPCLVGFFNQPIQA